MYKIIKLELYDLEGYITDGKGGVFRTEEYAIPEDLNVKDLQDDIDERFGESLSDSTEFYNSVFIVVTVKKHVDDKSLLVLKQNSTSLNASVCRINEICLYLNSVFQNTRL
ncbi:hypothetical protein [Mammaliicoccus vitulinus]|uniref:Uncharacterized protein n=1 Tax=Mammaliicoccus vitulinus TaxID=71237 RepID=A0ABX7HJ45_9STAP|nr:hypothetical protein [Mammaliicoccus vitulinus]MBM6629650.1 hypothetical protein [Mammaliicoccus vitulinus]MBO3077759.1 hypothetical protein [Mammaliicoccus vitulinus]MEB7657385.1 hypothetical protein [Mammaliicoccus vitulinus]PNZ40330.1 hypothetical protein CD107_02905 [Mammaliicoccus vitulinus]PTI71418.1 hypothetical protein BU073_07550 [Mammaliicoccus vitulinus]